MPHPGPRSRGPPRRSHQAPSSPYALLYASSFPPIQALSVESTLWLRDISLPATRQGLVSAWCGFLAGASAASAVRYLPEKTMGGVVVKGDPFPVKREKSRFPIIFLLFRQANHQLALRKVGKPPSAADIFESCSPQALISPRPRVLCGCFGESFRCPWRSSSNDRLFATFREAVRRRGDRC